MQHHRLQFHSICHAPVTPLMLPILYLQLDSFPGPRLPCHVVKLRTGRRVWFFKYGYIEVKHGRPVYQAFKIQ